MGGGDGTLDGLNKKLIPIKNYPSRPNVREIYKDEKPFRLNI